MRKLTSLVSGKELLSFFSLKLPMVEFWTERKSEWSPLKGKSSFHVSLACTTQTRFPRFFGGTNSMLKGSFKIRGEMFWGFLCSRENAGKLFETISIELLSMLRLLPILGFR